MSTPLRMIIDPVSGKLTPVTDLSATNSRLDNLEDTYVRITRFGTISANTSGSIAIPANNTVILDDFGGTTDAIITGITSGRPDFSPVYDSNQTLVTTTFDASGNWTLSAAPSSYPVAILYRTRVSLLNFDDTQNDIIGESQNDELNSTELAAARSCVGITAQGPVTTDGVSDSINEISESIFDHGQTGVLLWGSEAVNYYSWTPGNPGTFTILRSVTGIVAGKKVTAAAGQSVTLAYADRALIYIDANGVLQKELSDYASITHTGMRLFFAQNDINGEFAATRRDYSLKTDTGVQEFISSTQGPIVCDRVGCSALSRYGTGTGASVNDRKVNFTAGEIFDGSIVEAWSDYTTGTPPISHTYINGSGYYVRHSYTAEFPMVYINAGTATAIPSGEFGVFRLFVMLSDYNNPTPQFISEIDTTKYTTLDAARTAIGSGTVSGFSLTSPILAQVGFVIVQNNLSGGQIIETKVSRKTANGYLGASAGSAASADLVPTVSSEFTSGILTSSAGSVQQALKALSEGAAPDVGEFTKDISGFVDPENIGRSYSAATRKITLTHASGKVQYLWRNQLVELTSPWESDAHTADTNSWFLYSTDGANFTWSTTPWNFYDIQVVRACYTGSTHVGLAEVHGLMPWQDHQQAHDTTKTYRRSGGAVSGVVTGSTTAADRRPLIALTVVKDEDLITNNPALNTNSYTTIGLTGATPGTLVVATGAADIVPLSGNQPYYNQNNAGTWQQTLLPNNSHMNVWVVAVPVTDDTGSQSYRYCFLQGQNQGTLGAIQALVSTSVEIRTFLSVFPEWVFIHRFIVKFSSGNWTIEVSEPLTGTQASQVASSTSGLTSVQVDATYLSGNGTISSPLTVTSAVATATSLGPTIISGLTEKTALVSGDMFAVMDSGAANATKKVSAANLPYVALTGDQTVAGAKTFSSHPLSTDADTPTGNELIPVAKLGAVIAGATAKSTPVSADSLPICDSAASNALKETTFGELKTFTRIGESTAASGYIGELVESTAADVAMPASGAFNDLAYIILTPGLWVIDATVTFKLATGTGMSYVGMGVSTSTGNSSTGLTYGSTRCEDAPPTASYNKSQHLPGLVVSVGTNTTYYLKYYGGYTGGTPTASGRISAVRRA